MRCLNDEEIRRGLTAVIQGFDRCAVCGLACDDHDHVRHAFDAVDVLTVFVTAARSGAETVADPVPDPR